MKKTDIPQDPSPLDKFTREVCYAVNENGEYETGLSRGWQVKADALGITLNDVQQRVEDARKKIAAGEVSVLLFFIEANMMDVPMVAAYTGFWQWTVKRHLKPQVFKNLSDKKLQKYAEVFKVSVNELRNFE
ncbi:MAG: hypothetical protein KIS94_01000 [Chitinophagales bacterium]|nr:hypothetical protein [Chitinophagales bacterium]